MKESQLMISLAIIFIIFLGAGCGSLQNGLGWGHDAIYPLESKRIHRAAYNALFDLQTLIPAAGALVFALGDIDGKLSDYAVRHNPIFGSEDAARNASDYLSAILYIDALLTGLVTPSGKDTKEWSYSKIEGTATELAALGMTEIATVSLKAAINRRRPDGSNEDSFPSSHSSCAFSAATLANQNVDSIPLSNKVKLPMQIANILLAASVSWARVEGKQLFPSDVLAGATLGYFLTAFVHDAFPNLQQDKGLGFFVLPLRGGAIVQLSLGF